jgi:hypothetical protein
MNSKKKQNAYIHTYDLTDQKKILLCVKRSIATEHSVFSDWCQHL